MFAILKKLCGGRPTKTAHTATHKQNSCHLRLEALEDRCMPSSLGALNSLGADSPLLIQAPLGGGHSQVALQLSDGLTSRLLPNGTIQTPVDPCLTGLARAILGGEFPPNPIIPGVLGGGHAQVALQVSDGLVSRLLPNGTIQSPGDPCLPGLARAILGGNTSLVTLT
jgi:hypothetical protein